MGFLMFRNDCFFGKNTISPDFKAGHLQTRGFFFKTNLIFSTKKHKKKEEKKNPKYQPADNKISQHLILLGKNIKFIFKCDILI